MRKRVRTPTAASACRGSTAAPCRGAALKRSAQGSLPGTRACPLSALEEGIVRRELARLLFQHDRHVVANRIGKAVHAADEHLRVALVLERSLADGAGQYFEQASIHGALTSGTRKGAKLAHHAIEQLTGVRHAELRGDRHIPV